MPKLPGRSQKPIFVINRKETDMVSREEQENGAERIFYIFISQSKNKYPRCKMGAGIRSISGGIADRPRYDGICGAVSGVCGIYGEARLSGGRT